MPLWKRNVARNLTCLVVGVLAYALFGFAKKEQVKEQAIVLEQEQPEIALTVLVPTAPDSVTFGGQTISLTRYDRRESFDRELTSFTYFHSATLMLFKRANRYFPIIEPILKEQGIPDDFKYLAVIESNLTPTAISSAKAAGIWQLMDATARQYGLTVTATVDERFHIEKATVCACRYFRKAYETYGNWTTVAASYNAGMGRISAEIDKQRHTDALDLWLIEETARYTFRILAIKQLFEHPARYGFVLKAGDLYKPIACDTVTVTADIDDLALFATRHGITYADLKRFNPWLRERRLPASGKTYRLLIPNPSALHY